jgi:hypothetical protein
MNRSSSSAGGGGGREQKGEKGNDRPRGGNDRPLGCRAVSPTWIWLQAAIIVFVLIGMVVAITKLA